MWNLDENVNRVIIIVLHFANLYFLLFPIVRQCANILVYPDELATFFRAYDQRNFEIPIRKKYCKSF